MSRTGVLSDEYVTEHCAKYAPIPIGKSRAILAYDFGAGASPRFGRKLKYSQPPSRPITFDTMAKSIARVGRNPKILTTLEKQYNEELITAPTQAVIRPPNTIYDPDARIASILPTRSRTVETQTAIVNGPGDGPVTGLVTPPTKSAQNRKSKRVQGMAASPIIDISAWQQLLNQLPKEEYYLFPGRKRNGRPVATDPVNISFYENNYEETNNANPEPTDDASENANESTVGLI